MKTKIVFLAALLPLAIGCRGVERLTGIERHSTRAEDPAPPVVVPDPTPTPDPIPTFLLAGQSNMVRFSDLAADAFRADYAATHGGKVPVLIPCGVGGTYSPQWLPGGELFNGCINAAQGKTVTGILYYQGESDAYWSTPNWGDNFGATIAGFRQHFGNVPVVFAQIAIATDPDFLRGWTFIQDQQAAVSIPGVRMIVTKDLAVLVDTVHLSAESLQRIAQRFADAI